MKSLVVLCVFVAGTFAFPDGTQPCYNENIDGYQGRCYPDNCCAFNYYISNLCPNWPNNFKCCFRDNTCNAGCGSCSSATARDYACRILGLYEAGRMWLKSDHFDPRGNNPYDGASVLCNVRDTCYGRQGKRSSYGNAPGGCVCLGANMLRNMYDYALDFNNVYGQAIQVNSLAGSSHSITSHHYQGTTFDIACTTPRNHCTALVNFCSSRGAHEMCYPGSSCGGHDTWVHCAFY